MKLSPFQIAYGFNPHAPIDLFHLPPSETCFDVSQRSEFILKMHETTKLNIQKMNVQYRIAGSKGRGGGSKIGTGRFSLVTFEKIMIF
jgi:hypothetical protein